MHTTTAPFVPTAHDKALMEAGHVTYTFTTANSHYTVVVRPMVGAVVICDAGTLDGQVMVGTDVHLIGRTLILRDNANDRTVFRSTHLTGYYVLSN